jgi:hypothetical protein
VRYESPNPRPLLSYTNKKEVEANGATFADLLADLDRQLLGLRFRVIEEGIDQFLRETRQVLV